MQALVLEGQKIILRPLRASDAEAVYRNINDARVVRYLVRVPWPYRRRDAVKFITRLQRERRQGRNIALALVLKNKQRLIGTVGVKNIDTRHRHAKLGYWVGRRYWGKGYMTEAVALVLQFCFRMQKLHRVYASVLDKNVASARVLEKCGFKKEGVARDQWFLFGRWHNFVHYAILKGEYFKHR